MLCTRKKKKQTAEHSRRSQRARRMVLTDPWCVYFHVEGVVAGGPKTWQVASSARVRERLDIIHGEFVTDTMYVLLSQEFHRRHTNRLSQPLSARETFNHVPLAGGWMVAQNPTVLSLFLCLWNSLYNLDSWGLQCCPTLHLVKGNVMAPHIRSIEWDKKKGHGITIGSTRQRWNKMLHSSTQRAIMI